MLLTFPPDALRNKDPKTAPPTEPSPEVEISPIPEMSQDPLPQVETSTISVPTSEMELIPEQVHQQTLNIVLAASNRVIEASNPNDESKDEPVLNSSGMST